MLDEITEDVTQKTIRPSCINGLAHLSARLIHAYLAVERVKRDGRIWANVDLRSHRVDNPLDRRDRLN
jgi:hypothetical protein